MKPALLAASVQGASHIRTGTECQDSYKKVTCENGTVILSVADGHGSKACPHSKTGSVIAVNTFCKVLEEYVTNFSEQPAMLMTYLNREGDTKIAQAIDAEWKRRVYKAHVDNKREVPLSSSGEKNKQAVYAQYGTTLLGLVLTESFLFALQIGDGDIVYISQNGVEPVVQSEKILGVETHSLSKPDAWKKAITTVRRIEPDESQSAAFLLSTDGFANSYKNAEEFDKTCRDYLSMLDEYGAKAVATNLKGWLTETSTMGCGDDITVLIAYYGEAPSVAESEDNGHA